MPAFTPTLTESVPAHIQKLLIEIEQGVPVVEALPKLSPHLDKDLSLYTIFDKLGFSRGTNSFTSEPNASETIRLIT